MRIKREVICMCPRATIENVPSEWNKISVAIYHIYYEGCSLQNTEIRVYAVPMFKLQKGYSGPHNDAPIWTK